MPHPGHPPRPLRRRRRGRAPPGPPLRRRPPPRRTLRVLRRAATAAARRLARGARHRRLWRSPRRRPGLAAAAVAGAGRPGRTPTRRTSGTPKRLPGSARSARPAATALALRPHPAAARPRSSCSARSRTHHDLHLWLPHPSDDLWRALAGESRRRSPAATTPATARSTTRCWPPSAATSASCSAAWPDRRRRPTTTWRGSPRPDTLLGWLQSDITANAVRPARPARSHADDRSVQVHSCHGPARQIDVLREVLLGLLADDPTLEPRDILVMCPDIETYAPLIVAGFGLGDMIDGVHPAHRLRVRLADRSLVQTNPLLGVASQLLDLAGAGPRPARCSTSPRRAPVRRPLRLHRRRPRRHHRAGCARPTSAGASTASTASRTASTSSRTPGVSASTACSPGVAMSDDSHAWLDTTLPLDDVGSNRVELAGRLAEYVDRLHRRRRRHSPAPDPLREWLTALGQGIDRADPGRPTPTPGRPASCSASSPTCSPRPVRPRATPRCGCPTSARCWTATSPDGRPAPTSAPAR